jgi:hypothetical protein
MLKEVVVALAAPAVLFLYRTTKLDHSALHGWALAREVARGPELPFFTIVLSLTTAVKCYDAYRPLPEQQRALRNGMLGSVVLLIVLATYAVFSLVGYYDLMVAYEHGARTIVEWASMGRNGPPPPVAPYPEAELQEWTSTHMWLASVALALSIAVEQLAGWAERKYLPRQ